MRRALSSGPVVALLAAAVPCWAADQGDIERGADIWRRCKSCHQIGPEAVNRTGPHLNGLFDRGAGAVEGFSYSRSMERAAADGLTWTLDTLDVYLENPKSLVSGTNMRFGGIKDRADRSDLIAFLRTFSSSPADIPEGAPTALPRDPDVAPEVLAIEGDAEWGEYLSSECLTCHQQDGGDAGIPSITGWHADDFVVAMHAYKTQHRPHPVMQMMAGRLSEEEIAALAAYFAQLE